MIHPDVVRDAIKKNGIRKADIAKRADVHPNSLTGVESLSWNPKWLTLESLCSAIDEIKRDRA